MLFEKVLRRICPCYFARSDENEVLCGAFQEHVAQCSENQQTTRRFTDATVGCPMSDGQDVFSAVSYWGGNIHYIHPQPVYAIPSEINKTVETSTNLLRPPLYWKKTLKTFGTKGPPVIQEDSRSNLCAHHQRKVTRRRRYDNVTLKHSGTMIDLRSKPSENSQDCWTKSHSFNELRVDDCVTCKPCCKPNRMKNPSADGDCASFQRCNLNVFCSDDFYQDCKKFKVIPDISYGVIVFSAAYNPTKKLLLLKIDRLENLALKGRGGNTYNTVIKLSVSPSDKYVKCTKVLKKSTCPEVKEDFSFTVKENSGKVLRLSVFDSGIQNPLNAVGHAILSLDNVMSRHTKKFRMKLYRHTRPHITPGNLSLSLSYRPEDYKFAVLVDKAKNLMLQKDKNVKLSTYVKGTLYSNGIKVKSNKSLLISNSKDPRYNSTFTFHVDEADVDDLLLVMSVRLKSFVRDATIGRVILGPFFITDYKKLTPWGRVFLKREYVTHWFRLYL